MSGRGKSVLKETKMTLSLNQYLYTKEILIDDAGWGDLILGAVIGVLRLPERKYMERRIPLSAFQSPNFENKMYLEDASRIAEEILRVMQPGKDTSFKICRGYILSRLGSYLRDQGFHVETTTITGELQEKVEKSFVEWCKEVGVPTERLEDEKRFYPILEWVAERIEPREKLVKTGWSSWQKKWREEAYKIHIQKIAKLRTEYYARV